VAAQPLVGGLQLDMLLPLPPGQDADEEGHCVQQGDPRRRPQEKAPAEDVPLQGPDAGTQVQDRRPGAAPDRSPAGP